MTIYELAEVTGTKVQITDYGFRFSACLSNAEIKEGEFLATTFGEGKSPGRAICDYVRKIRGRTIVLNSIRGLLRKSFSVPKSLVCTTKRRKKLEEFRIEYEYIYD